jgi:hypothetical protein
MKFRGFVEKLLDIENKPVTRFIPISPIKKAIPFSVVVVNSKYDDTSGVRKTDVTKPTNNEKNAGIGFNPLVKVSATRAPTSDAITP